MSVKRVLMTNLYFERYTGSELHTLEMARLFEEKGFEVTIAVYKKSYPLLNEAGDWKIIECETEELDEWNYDIIFVQHFPVFDYLCCRYELTFHKLVVSKLSIISELEELPVCTHDADMILCVSRECADSVRDKIGDDERIRVFKNCVSQSFFERFQPERPQEGQNKKPEKVAVISNHVPPELRELGVKMKEKAGCRFDYIGMESMPRLVTADVLKEYDLVITIGRTVQQCFAAGVPVYVYDYFGGPGYIDHENFETAEKNNFSGRGFSQLSADELTEDIISNYEAALLRLEELYKTALERYDYNKEFDKIYAELYKKQSKVRQTGYYTGIEGARLSLYTRVLPSLLKMNQKSQIYFDRGDGFCEENSVSWNSVEDNRISKVIDINGPVSRLRFDPCDIPCKYHIYEFKVNGQLIVPEKEITCLANDPQFEIVLSETAEGSLQIEIAFSYSVLGIDEIMNINARKIHDLESLITGLRKENAGLNAEIARLKSKKLYRLEQKVRKGCRQNSLKKPDTK